MFHVRPLAKALLIVASALGLCVAQGVSAFPEDTIDPGTPPSESPDHSGELFNFGSTFIFSFSQGVEGFSPEVSIDCLTCSSFPVGPGPHTFTLTGQVLGQIRDNPDSAGVYNMNITITGVRAEASEPVVGDGFSEQTIKYTADLTGGGEEGEFNAVVTGDLELDGEASLQPNPPPAGDPPTITVGAQAGVTPGLVTAAGPAQTFPPVPSSSPAALGQPVAANVVFQVTEKKRVQTGGGID